MNWLKERFALSDKGAFDLAIGSLACALQNLTLMLPVGLIYSFVMYIILLCRSGLNIQNQSAVFYLSTGFVCAFLIFFSSWFQYNSTFLSAYRESGVRRVTLAERLRKIPLSFFMHMDIADITASIMNDCAVLETNQSHYLAPLIGSLISTTLIALSLIFIDWRMALAALWVLPVSFAIVGLSAKIQHKFSGHSLSARISCEEGVQEFIEAQKDIRSNNFTGKYLEGLTDKIKLSEKLCMRSELGTAVFVVSAYLVLRLGIASTALTGAFLYAHDSLSANIFMFFILAVSRLYDPLEVSLQNLAAIIATRSSIDRMNTIMHHELQTGSNTLTNKGYDIEFKNVCFDYDGHEVLHNVSFTAKQGEVTALVGASGSGKTTAAKLIMRFMDINRGIITVGGMNIADIDPETLMSLFSMVFQDVILFNASVLDNIRIGRKGAKDSEVIQAGRLANCEEFVSRLPKKWNTLIGENGCKLSGGERQRISIARAMLKNSPVVILDEATASLDAENETVIQNALSKLIRNKTVIIIAHRMRTIMNADKIIVLDDGRIIESGSPEELMRNENGKFFHMVNIQREG